MGHAHYDSDGWSGRAVDGAALLLANTPALFVPVLGMVAGVAAVASANHERLKLRIAALEQRIAQ